MRIVRELPSGPDAVPIYSNPDWAARFPWLVQGITARGPDDRPFDLRLFGDEPAGSVLRRWRMLRDATATATVVHASQVHGTDVLVHAAGPAGLILADAADGHATRQPGILLTVSVADCVPVFLVDPETRAIALLHAGWRGVAAGILQAGVDALARLAGSRPAGLHAHLGPAICGACYEVGPEVHAALGRPAPASSTPIDLRSVLARQAGDAGVLPDRISASEFCTLCGDAPFFSHRAGRRERQVAVLAVAAAH